MKHIIYIHLLKYNLMTSLNIYRPRSCRCYIVFPL